MFNTQVALAAFSLSLSQIVGIGPQNAFVIRQGIGHSHVLPIVLICIVCDLLLIAAGVFGMGSMVLSIPGFLPLVTWTGAAFILWLGIKAFRSACKPATLRTEGGSVRDRDEVIRTLLAVTLLNPYVWLDTVILIGSLSAAYGTEARLSFLAGSSTASVLWFVAIGVFSMKLAPLFRQERSWRVLDVMVGVLMVMTAASLIQQHGLQYL